MLVLKPIILCVITLIVVIMLKNFSPEFVPIAVLSCGIFILIYLMPYITSVLNLVESLGSRAVNISPIIKNTLKIIVIAVVCEFASQICDDSGQGYLSSKINFVGKIIILSAIAPLILNFIEYIIEMSYDI